MSKVSGVRPVPEPRREFFESDEAYRYFLDLTRALKSLQVGTADDLASHQHTVSDVTDLTLGKTIGDVPQYEDDGSGNPVVDHPNHPLVNGVSVLVAPGASSDPALAFDTWRTPNANRPTKVLIGLQAQTDSTTNGHIFVEIDLSGGTTPDFRLLEAVAQSNLPSGSIVYGYTEATVPAGASYQINNFSDPNSANGIVTHQEFTL